MKPAFKVTRQRYQHGSIRKVQRAHGFAWEFRYYATDESGQRKARVQTFDSAIYKTERDVRKAVQGQLATLNANTLAGRVNMTFGALIDRYLADELPTLKHSTQNTNRSLLNLHIRPRWSEHRLTDIKPLAVKTWIDGLPFGAASKVRARNIISRLLDLAMLWEYIPTERNPMELVKVKGSSKREKPITIITPEQFKAIVDALPKPYSLMVLVCGVMGLRVSEMLALKWTDFNFDERTLAINRVFTHNQIQASPKSDASSSTLPVYDELIDSLQAWRTQQEHDFDYVFASPRTAGPYSPSTILTDYLKPAAKKQGIAGLGWHTFRHSYKAWMAQANTNPATMKDLMRHAAISTTMDVYGRTLTEEMRRSNDKVASLLF